jgi:nicotinate-nucleotide pyrophosphorylase (carboxylating)
MTRLSETTSELLLSAGLDPAAVADLVTRTLAEDLGEAGDITSAATVPATAMARARYVSRAAGTLAGMPVVAAIADLSIDTTFEPLARDGDTLVPGQPLGEITGPARELLAIERTSLNLLGHMCGVATVTAEWVAAVAGTSTRIRDTRKTMPMLRELDKYAVRCGGGVNHRRGLDDAILIKDNHVAAAGGVGAALDAVWRVHPPGSLIVQVEVDDLEQLDEALAHGAPQILLDNLDPATCRIAVERIRSRAPGVAVEASGGLTLGRAAAYAATGVDFLAIGALTHSTPALDIGLDFI